MLARDIMNKNVITVKEDDTIEELAAVLTENHISGAPVVNGEGKLVGIIAEGDLLHKETNPRLPGYLNILGALIYIGGIKTYKEDLKKLAATKASEIMTKYVITASEDTPVEQVATLMVINNIKRVPVIENGNIVGIISRADIVKTMARQA